jgi:hypothetical protein
MALMAWRLCRQAHGTNAFPFTLFVCIPVIYEPFNYIFVFGGYDGSISQTLYWAGLLNMTSNYLAKTTAEHKTDARADDQTLRSDRSSNSVLRPQL